MSNDFNKAVDFLQGALDAATQEVTEPQATAEEPRLVAEAPAVEKTQPAEEEANPTAEEAQSTVDESEAVETTETAGPATPNCPCAASPEKPAAVGLGKLAASILIAVCMGVAIVAAHKLIHPRTVTQVVEKEVVREVVREEGVPLALLPATADASLWDTVASMSGTIGGIPLQFRRGIATANGATYRVCLDFCRNNGTIYVRITGNGKWWVSQVAADGKIIKAYPARANAKPLKDVFGK